MWTQRLATSTCQWRQRSRRKQHIRSVQWWITKLTVITLHCESQKRPTILLIQNFCKRWPIFKLMLWVLCLPAKQCVSSVSAHSLRVSVCHFRLLKWETSTFISSGLWLQHPDLNPMNYKICIKIRQQVCLEKNHNVNGPTLWYGWHGFKQHIINNATNKWCKRLWVCIHLKWRLFSIQFDCRFYICTF